MLLQLRTGHCGDLGATSPVAASELHNQGVETLCLAEYVQEAA